MRSSASTYRTIKTNTHANNHTNTDSNDQDQLRLQRSHLLHPTHANNAETNSSNRPATGNTLLPAELEQRLILFNLPSHEDDASEVLRTHNPQRTARLGRSRTMTTVYVSSGISWGLVFSTASAV